eukprot:COSAG05_NODE_690_length_7901_cov_174.242886_6_plen_59_part_00
MHVRAMVFMWFVGGYRAGAGRVGGFGRAAILERADAPRLHKTLTIPAAISNYDERPKI